MKIEKDLVAASATPLVLAILAEGETYGYAILQRVAEATDGTWEWTDGMLYPLLHRLERQGHLTSRWQQAEGERRRKYYQLTESGFATLAERKRQWHTVAEALAEIWGPGTPNKLAIEGG